ncbi:MAG: metallophosphoesterase [Candidatus Parabeggiatoa sp.]|nr:metallophosphoesterase [Candidatus Parabeggiatoa sp.]
MKILLTSDWHMGIYNDPGDTLKLDNNTVLSLLSSWETEYDLIVLNGDILESLKSARVFFSHYDQTLEVLKARKPIIQRFLDNPKYLWLIGNHDYPLETILNLPSHIEIPLSNGYTLIAEHGHLLRAPKTLYSDFGRHYYLMYWLIWYIDKCQASKHPKYSIEFVFEQWLEEYRKESPTISQSRFYRLKKLLLRVAFFIIDMKADQPAHNFSDFLCQSAQSLFKGEKTIVSFGHTHYSEIKYSENKNIYINTGRFCTKTAYPTTVFDTITGEAMRIYNTPDSTEN